jgi:hypothetical protein
LIGYTIYTGASAILEDAKRSNQGPAHPVLRTFLRALNAGQQRCPLLQRSLNIIMKGLNHTAPNHEAPLNNGGYGWGGTASTSANRHEQAAWAAGHYVGTAATEDEAIHMKPYIPAFPYLDPATQIDFGLDPYFSAQNPQSTGVLDSFPELQLDGDDFLYSLQ